MRRHPEQVAGLILIDAGNSLIYERVAPHVNWIDVGSVCFSPWAARFGMLRLADPFGLRRMPEGVAAPAIARLYRVEPMSTLCGVARGFRTTAREMVAVPPFPPELPLIALVHEKPDGLLPPGLSGYSQSIESEWLGLQERFVQYSRRGTWRVVPGSDHLIGDSRPHEVAATILEMVAKVRGER